LSKPKADIQAGKLFGEPNSYRRRGRLGRVVKSPNPNLELKLGDHSKS
jgi:hypothetical protein